MPKIALRQGCLFELELLYDFCSSFFVDVFGLVDGLKQFTFAKLMHSVNPESGGKLVLKLYWNKKAAIVLKLTFQHI